MGGVTVPVFCNVAVVVIVAFRADVGVVDEMVFGLVVGAEELPDFFDVMILS